MNQRYNHFLRADYLVMVAFITLTKPSLFGVIHHFFELFLFKKNQTQSDFVAQDK